MMVKKSMLNDMRPRVYIIAIISAIGIYASVYRNYLALGVFAFQVICALALNTQEIVGLLFFTLPFTMIYKASPTSSSFFIYFHLYCVVLLFVRNKFRLNGSKNCMLLFAAAIIYIFLGMGSSYVNYIKQIVSFVFALLFLELIERRAFPKICTMFCLGTVISGLIGMQKGNWPALDRFFSELNYEYISGNKTIRFSALYLDPNYYSILVIACILTLLIYTARKEINPYFGGVLIAPLLWFGLLSYSRTFYISLVLISIACFVIFVKNSKHPEWSATIIVAICMIVVYVVSQKGILSGILMRFGKDDVSNGRFDIWKNYLSYIMGSIKTLCFGDGIGADVYAERGAHNTYIELLYYFGTIGSAIYCLLIVSLLSVRRARFRRSIGNYSMLAVFLVESATLGMLNMNDLMFQLLIAWMIMNTKLSGYDGGLINEYE